MPTLNIATNLTRDQIPADFLENATDLLSSELGKPKQYILIQVNPDQMMSFGGTQEPCANISLGCIGVVSPDKNKELAPKLSKFIETSLGIKQDRQNFLQNTGSALETGKLEPISCRFPLKMALLDLEMDNCNLKKLDNCFESNYYPCFQNMKDVINMFLYLRMKEEWLRSMDGLWYTCGADDAHCYAFNHNLQHGWNKLLTADWDAIAYCRNRCTRLFLDCIEDYDIYDYYISESDVDENIFLDVTSNRKEDETENNGDDYDGDNFDGDDDDYYDYDDDKKEYLFKLLVSPKFQQELKQIANEYGITTESDEMTMLSLCNATKGLHVAASYNKESSSAGATQPCVDTASPSNAGYATLPNINDKGKVSSTAEEMASTKTQIAKLSIKLLNNIVGKKWKN